MKPSRRKQTTKRALIAFATALPYILSAALLTQTIYTRQEVRDLRNLLNPDWSDAERIAGGLPDWRAPTVTVTSTVTEYSTSRSTSPRQGWFGDGYTVTYSSPTQKPKPSSPPRAKQKPKGVRETNDDASMPEQSSKDDTIDDDDTYDYDGQGSPVLPLLSWTTQIDFDQAKAGILHGWGRVWRVVEIILHWPMPPDAET